MKRHSQVIGILFAAVVLVAVSQPAHAYLYTGGSASPSISGPSHDAGGHDIFTFPDRSSFHRPIEWKDYDGKDHDGKDHHGKDHHGSITPIPSAAWLIGSGLLGLIGLQRRRNRKS